MTALDDSGDVWVDEIYQIEQTDPVLGGTPNEATKAGLSNIPLQQLAKRTSWLKRFFAPLDSPDLTGTPTTPTPALADNSVRIPTTGWVRAALPTLASAAGFVVSLTSAGYIVFPSWLGRLVIEWGVAVQNGTFTAPITFPIAFPTAPLTIVAMHSGTAATIPFEVDGSLTRTGVTLKMQKPGEPPLSGWSARWIAIGY